jgi:hypothetical protein
MFFPVQESINYFIALWGPSPISFVHWGKVFLRNLNISLDINRWYMVYFFCNFQGVRLLWVASAKMLEKLQFPYFSHCSKALFL